MSPGRRVALSIAGTDSSGGAGVTADVRTFAAHGLWGACAVTAVTAQDARGVRSVRPVAAEAVTAQLRCALADGVPSGAKTGMLVDAATVAAVAGVLDAAPGLALVVDPVAVASSGTALLDDDGVDALRRLLLPRAALVTPNLAEASRLTGLEVAGRAGAEAAARALVALGAAAALVTGGHLDGGADDCLWIAGEDRARWLRGPRVATTATHGTGCALSAAICARLARGDELVPACAGAKRWVTGALRAGLETTGGTGPLDTGWAPG